MYIPYDGADRLQGIGLMPEYGAAYNCLIGKKAMWNGDSICAADNDAKGGWPMRIGAANGMYAKNYGVSGGTIAENTGAAHSVCATLDTMISAFPDADYIIIEGGTNDADILGDGGIGSFDADDFSAAYIQALNEDTFSGALESVFYRLVTQMKGKHIGYLIPQKMGHTEVLVARRRTYFDRAVAIAEKWGIPVLDLWKGLYFNWRLSAHWDQDMTSAQNEAAGNLYQDGQHLTTTGYAIQSPIIAEWMKGI
jgi:lysophospholipase L1-like esterase